jgi:hypothetical protein
MTSSKSRHFFECTQASVGVIFGIAAVPLMIISGVAVDISKALIIRGKAQAALDSAMLNLGKEIKLLELKNLTNAYLTSRAQTLLDAAHDDKMESSMVVSASIDPTTTAVTATATRDISTILSSVIGIKTIQVSVRSQMLAESKSVPSCLIALKTSGTGIRVTGHGSITAPNCGVYINSSASNALFGQSNGTLWAQATSIVGNYQLNIVPTPRPYINQKPIDDPLISLTQPAESTKPSKKLCDYSSDTFKGTMTISPKSGSNVVIYCGNTKFQGRITLGQGLHVFYGNVSMQSSTSLVGDGVTIFLGDGANWDSTGSGTFRLSPLHPAI